MYIHVRRETKKKGKRERWREKTKERTEGVKMAIGLNKTSLTWTNNSDILKVCTVVCPSIDTKTLQDARLASCAVHLVQEDRSINYPKIASIRAKSNCAQVTFYNDFTKFASSVEDAVKFNP